jgi:hypothetical protein
MPYTITREGELIRRIPQQHSFFKQNAQGESVFSSAAFTLKKDEDGLLVDIAALTTLEQAFYTPRTLSGETVTGALLLAAVPTSLGCTCVHDPTAASAEQPANEAHALIKGNMNKSFARKLSDASRLIEESATSRVERVISPYVGSACGIGAKNKLGANFTWHPDKGQPKCSEKAPLRAEMSILRTIR